MRLNRPLSAARTALIAGALALTGVTWAGCGQTKATEYVAGFSSQVQVPRDLASIIIRVDVNGANAFEKDYPVYDGKVRLPQTLGVINESTPEGTPITITVYGFSVTDGDPSYSAFSTGAITPPTVGGAEVGCTAGDTTCAASNGGGARVLRASRQPYVPGQIIYLPMPLHYACYDVDCGPNGSGTSEACQAEAANSSTCTCKAGECVPPDTDQTVLPVYNDSLIEGSTNTCFRPFSDSACPAGDAQCGCMDYEVTPQPIGDPSDCVFSLPTCTAAGCSTPGAGPYVNPDFSPALVAIASEGGGLNVRVVYDNLVSEVLDYEGNCPSTWPPTTSQFPQEGYCNYADTPGKFRLAPGLCNMYTGTSTSHQITLLEASASCPSKTAFQPICDDTIQGPPQPTLLDGGQSADGVCNANNPLQPAKSALYILFDKSSGMRDFLGSAGLGEVLGLSLTDPVFQQTQVGLMYPPAQQSDCTQNPNEFALDVVPDSGLSVPSGTIPFEFAGLAQGDIGNSLLAADGGSVSGASVGQPWYLEAALQGAYFALNNLSNASSYNRRAVMLFYDRDFGINPTDCAGGHEDAITEANGALQAGVETYAVYLASADFPDGGVPGDPAGHGQQLAQGLTPGNQYFFNATSQAQGAAEAQAALALASVVADLGSCVYEVPLHFVPGVALNFPDYAPLLSNAAPETVNVKYDVNCAADDGSTTSTYVFDNQHIRICQNTCKRLVKSITDDEIYTAQLNQGRSSPLPTKPVDVGWGYACGSSIPDASIVESGSAAPTVSDDAGTTPADADVEDSGAIGNEDAGG